MEPAPQGAAAALPHDKEPQRPDPIPRVTWEGCSVLLDVNDGDRLVFARLSPNATLKIGNKKCLLSPLIGCPFGSLFRVESGPVGPRLARCVPSSHVDCVQDNADGRLKNALRDNRSLVDDNTAQSLSSDDIDTMRREGATGDDIVEALIANSSTFGMKTVFSQEKYTLKKQKKYAPKVLLRRPSTRSICETYFKKYPDRIWCLRVDALSLLLSMANIGAYSDVLVVDKVGGLLIGAVAERLGGTGYVCSAYFGSVPNPMPIVRMFNFSDDICSRIVQAPFSDLCSTQNHSDQPPSLNENTLSPSKESTIADVSEFSLSNDEVLEKDSLSESGHNENGLNIHKLVKVGKRPAPETRTFWRENGFSSLLVATPEIEVGSLMSDLLPLLSYSAPFAIYHQYLQPLATCMHNLQASKTAIGLQISEPWLREYQVLPSRTHPHMQMSVSGGYILSGIRVCSDENVNSPMDISKRDQ